MAGEGVKPLAYSSSNQGRHVRSTHSRGASGLHVVRLIAVLDRRNYIRIRRDIAVFNRFIYRNKVKLEKYVSHSLLHVYFKAACW